MSKIYEIIVTGSFLVKTMSNIYHTEPPTSGKVLLHTSFGDVDIELWSKEAPLACRNFIQLSLEGYYDNTPIHRVIKDFMLQGGDPTGTGEGGKSIWNRAFKDEIHGRIKFNHRGQVAMANENKPNSNNSQFFITLGACEWLDRKHTIFGKVTGNTMYNVLRIGGIEVDAKDRPIDPIYITRVEVLWNPFEDIIPRDLALLENKKARADINQQQQGEVKKKPKIQIKTKKDTNLLSFEEDEVVIDTHSTNKNISDELKSEPVAVKNVRMISSHDSKLKDDKLSPEVAEELLATQSTLTTTEMRENKRSKKESHSNIKDNNQSITSGTRKPSTTTEEDHHRYHDDDDDDDEESYEKDIDKDTSNNHDANNFRNKMKKQILNKQRNVIQSQSSHLKNANAEDDQSMTTEEMLALSTSLVDLEQQKEQLRRSKEYNELKEQLLRSRKAVKVLTGVEAEQAQNEFASSKLVSLHEQRRQRFMKRKRDIGDRQSDTLSKLNQFTNAFRSKKGEANATSKASTSNDQVEVEVESYHGQILEKNSDDERDDLKLEEWCLEKLKFRNHHIDHAYRMGGDGRKLDDYDVIDSREKPDPMSILKKISK